MTASYQPRRASSRRLESPFSWGFLGILLLALELLLPTCSDACDDLLTFQSMKPKGYPEPPYHPGDTVEYECRPGYKHRFPVLSISAVCQPDDTWAPLQEACTNACDDPPRYQSMKIKGNPKPSYNAGDTIEYECRLGYKRIVPFLPMSTVCQPSNTWVPPLQEACTKKACQQLGDLVNGDVVYANGSMEFGSQAHFKCNAGYYLIGPKTLYCELAGNNVEWSDNLPSCEKVLCKPPPKIPNGEFTNSHKATFEYNELVTYSCKPSGGPDEYSLVGERKLICIGHDKWSSNPPECKDACDEIPRYESMKAKGNPQPPVSSGFEVEYECRPGFRLIVPLVRPTTTVCQPDGTWAPPLQEACTRKSCLQPAEPLNGHVEGTFQLGTQANYSCNEGYYLLGSPVIHCELSGNDVVWSDEPPLCEKILCQPPQQIPNGEFSNSDKDTFEYNEMVTYRCKTSNGPDEYSLVGESRLICSGPNKWSSDPPECKVVKCPYPSLPDGTIVSGFGKKYYYKAEVEFECNQGYSLEGSRKIVCEANSTWVPEIPRCVKDILCQPPQQIENGIFSSSHKDTFEYNEMVTYRCNPSNGPDEYSLVGESRLICSGRNKWSSDPPECKGKSCPQLAEPLNGRLEGSFQFGSQANYSCNEGAICKLTANQDGGWQPLS
ncbi:Membrane cofactor protein [Myotis brandtii]|uniref:Membrane cofactor protein n=1 Tax=Myotis brandtii TaxID=109478 RepID=S7Q7Q4_MYOBR|nr:Membrane cofactor protein [Myotis brandtii]